MSQIKICGLKRLEDVAVVNAYKPDFIGFIFADTKRFISDETAKMLKEALNPDIKAVGVFVNEPIAHIVKLVAQKSIDMIQLHGQEDKDYVNQLRMALEKTAGSQKKGQKSRIPLIKAVRIDASIAVTPGEAEKIIHENRQLIEEAKLCEPDYLLFDSKVKGILGGSGRNFDIAGLPDDVDIGLPYFLAGGIDLNHVKDVIQEKNPFGIDVSSAVETNGVKDAVKIKAMIEAVRNCTGHL